MNDYNPSTPEMPEMPEAVTPPAQPSAMPAIHVHMNGPRKSVLRLILRIVLVLAVLAVMGAVAMELSGVMGQFTGGSGWQVLEKGDKDQCIVVYRLTGVLNGESAAKFARFYNRVADDESVKAILIRVNSPGGTVSASQQIHHMIEQLKATGKPVVVSMSSVAASGGYMVSCNADEIFAEPATVTGSIGVIAQWFVVAGTLDKIGVEPITIKSTDADYWKDDLSPFHRPDPRQEAELRSMLNAMQTQFNDMVTAGRGDRLKPRNIPAPLPMPVHGQAITIRQLVADGDIPVIPAERLAPRLLKSAAVTCPNCGYAADDTPAESEGMTEETRQEIQSLREELAVARALEAEAKTGGHDALAELDAQMLDDDTPPRTVAIRMVEVDTAEDVEEMSEEELQALNRERLEVLNQARLSAGGHQDIPPESLGRLSLVAQQLLEGGGPLAPSLIETEPFNGKVYIAADALELGMIDQIGYQDAALDRAAELAGLDNANILVYTEHQGIFEGFMSFQSAGPAAQIEEAIDGASTPSIMAIYRMD